MKLIDVTMRDGGHQVNFDWDVSVVDKLLKSYESVPSVEFVEIGYWRQTGKFSGAFYNLSPDLLKQAIGGDKRNSKVGIMVDFHYCSKNIEEYPGINQGVSLIRVTARQEHVKEALDFGRKLSSHSGAQISLNIFNVSNYAASELEGIVDNFSKTPLDFLYFADTHGALDLNRDEEFSKFSALAQKIKSAGAKPGFHLHNHSGKALSNYNAVEQMGFEYADASINGLGKGLGNLKMEEILHGREAVAILQLWADSPRLFEMAQNPYGIVGAQYSTTDHYAEQALALGLEVIDFFGFVQQADRETKDNFDPMALPRFITNLGA